MKYALLLIILLALAACSSTAGAPTESAPTTAATPVDPSPNPTPRLLATRTPTPTPPTATPEPGFGGGTLIVGTDIDPGIYSTRPNHDDCYWERLSGFGGTFDEIIANGIGNPRHIVEILSTDAGFTSSGCGRWISAAENLMAPDGDGTWLVDYEWAPGTYRAQGGESCYWERLSGFTGDLDHIITNGLGSGAQIVTIQVTDAAFTTASCGTWERIE